MYVTPRPDVNDDPLFTVRLACVAMLSYAAVALLDPALPPIIAALPIGIVGSQRKAFDWGKAVGGPGAMTALTALMTQWVEWLRPMPLVYMGEIWLVYFGGFLMTLRTGAQSGMLVVVVAVLMSVMGMHGSTTVETLRDGFFQASLVALVLGPLVCLLFSPRTREQHVDAPVPGGGDVAIGAAIRASVLMGLSFWLYAVMQPSDMMMAMIAAMVLVFPTRESVFSEAAQRICATFYGCALGLAILGLFTLSQHLAVLLALIFLGCPWLTSKMLRGPRPSNVYQYAISVAMSLIAGALSTQDAGYAAFTPIVLTLAGAFATAGAAALLDALTGWQNQPAAPAQQAAS